MIEQTSSLPLPRHFVTELVDSGHLFEHHHLAMSSVFPPKRRTRHDNKKSTWPKFEGERSGYHQPPSPTLDLPWSAVPTKYMGVKVWTFSVFEKEGWGGGGRGEGLMAQVWHSFIMCVH